MTKFLEGSGAAASTRFLANSCRELRRRRRTTAD